VAAPALCEGINEAILRAVVLDTQGGGKGGGSSVKQVDFNRTRQTALYLLEVKAWTDANPRKE
jgi:hypothetical protein